MKRNDIVKYKDRFVTYRKFGDKWRIVWTDSKRRYKSPAGEYGIYLDGGGYESKLDVMKRLLELEWRNE